MAPLENAIKYFALWVNSLVDSGYNESIEEIEKQIETLNLVNYIGKKYKNQVDFSVFESDGPYSMEEVNKKFDTMSGYIRGNESRKFAVERNGLNLIVALSIEFLFNRN